MNTYSYEDGETNILDDLIRFYDHTHSTDANFVYDMYDFREEKGYITEKQMKVLEAVYKEKNVFEYLSQFYNYMHKDE